MSVIESQECPAGSCTISDFFAYAVEEATEAYNYASEMCRNLAPAVQSCAKKVEEISLPIFKVVASLLLFTAQSSMFVIGALVGVVSPEFMRNSIDRICLIWNSFSIGEKAAALVAGVIAFPITTALGAFFVAGNFSLHLLENAQGEQCPSS
jgi:hypothetical protein